MIIFAVITKARLRGTTPGIITASSRVPSLGAIASKEAALFSAGHWHGVKESHVC